MSQSQDAECHAKLAGNRRCIKQVLPAPCIDKSNTQRSLSLEKISGAECLQHMQHLSVAPHHDVLSVVNDGVRGSVRERSGTSTNVGTFLNDGNAGPLLNCMDRCCYPGPAGADDHNVHVCKLRTMAQATFEEFDRLDIRLGTIVRAEPFTEARKPAYKLWVDLGELGVCTSSAQITQLYTPEQLTGKQVVCVCGLGGKQIGPWMSEVLVTGFHQPGGAVTLCVPDSQVPNGTRLR